MIPVTRLPTRLEWADPTAQRLEDRVRPGRGSAGWIPLMNDTNAQAPYSRPWWERLVRSSTAGAPEFQADVVDRLMEHPEEGIWHAAAVVTNRECFCAKCKPGTERLA